MKTKDIIDLFILAALWGASFLFMRISVPEFGAVPMMMVRVLIAGLCLLPLVIWKGRLGVLRQNRLSISVVGVLGSAIPFSLIAYSTLYVTAGFASVLNAATPIFASVIAFVWLGQKISKLAALGLMIGVLGVTLLVWDKIGFADSNSGLAIAAGLAGTLFYGIAANYSKQKFTNIDSLSIACGSLLAAAVFLTPMAIFWWPQKMPSLAAWLNVIILAIACTAFAQILFFRLIESAGATNATTVTFLIPVFGLFWGLMFLDELVETNTVIAGVVILMGTGMTTGLIRVRR